MSGKQHNIAILFVDIAKSTHIYETLGNIRAQAFIDKCLMLLSDVVTSFRGKIIKTIGDELMCTFNSAQAAVEAALQMNRRLDDVTFSDLPNSIRANIYIGIQYGPVVQSKADVFGDAVNVAARMVALAKQRQIITTQETVDALGDNHGFNLRCIDKCNVKGKSGRLSIYEVIWEDQDVTMMLNGGTESVLLKFALELQFQGKTVVVDENRPMIYLGRQPHNDLVVNNKRVSRSHARIEYRRGKFILVDQSTNGAYLSLSGKPAVHIIRDEAQLIGRGRIGLGQALTDATSPAIEFVIRMADDRLQAL